MALCWTNFGSCLIFFSLWWLFTLQNYWVPFIIFETMSYGFFAAIFNVGWAATQVSHMSMVNCITLNSTSRAVLASCRNAFTMLANVSLYAVAFVVFNIDTIRLKREARENGHARVSWAHWFNKVLYYQMALVYVLTRLVTNVSQEIIWTGQRSKVLYSAGGLLWIISSAGLLFLPSSMSSFLYILSIVIGVANALMMVSGVIMQSFLVGRDLNGCTFVYGSLSFMDKVLCGLALCILESYQSSTPGVSNYHHPSFHFSVTRYGLGLVPAICSLIGVLVTLSMKLPDPSFTPLSDTLLA